MRISFDLTADDIAESFLDMRQDELIELILATDLRIAESDFTETLIKRLVLSIRGDLNAAQFADLVADLGSIA